MNRFRKRSAKPVHADDDLERAIALSLLPAGGGGAADDEAAALSQNSSGGGSAAAPPDLARQLVQLEALVSCFKENSAGPAKNWKYHPPNESLRWKPLPGAYRDGAFAKADDTARVVAQSTNRSADLSESEADLAKAIALSKEGSEADLAKAIALSQNDGASEDDDIAMAIAISLSDTPGAPAAEELALLTHPTLRQSPPFVSRHSSSARPTVLVSKDTDARYVHYDFYDFPTTRSPPSPCRC